jgi:hypothetical protein
VSGSAAADEHACPISVAWHPVVRDVSRSLQHMSHGVMCQWLRVDSLGSGKAHPTQGLDQCSRLASCNMDNVFIIMLPYMFPFFSSFPPCTDHHDAVAAAEPTKCFEVPGNSTLGGSWDPFEPASLRLTIGSWPGSCAGALIGVTCSAICPNGGTATTTCTTTGRWSALSGSCNAK